MASPATTQLMTSPSEPCGPPPSSRNVGSSGATVRPRASWKRRTAPDQEATQGDDERGDAHVGHQEAVDRADERADREAGKQRDDPQERSVEARTEERGDPLDLEQAP